MSDVTATLKKFYQKGPPENVLDVSRALSEQFSVPLPATSKFAESVHKAYLGLNFYKYSFILYLYFIL